MYLWICGLKISSRWEEPSQGLCPLPSLHSPPLRDKVQGHVYLQEVTLIQVTSRKQSFLKTKEIWNHMVWLQNLCSDPLSLLYTYIILQRWKIKPSSFCRSIGNNPQSPTTPLPCVLPFLQQTGPLRAGPQSSQASQGAKPLQPPGFPL